MPRTPTASRAWSSSLAPSATVTRTRVSAQAAASWTGPAAYGHVHRGLAAGRSPIYYFTRFQCHAKRGFLNNEVQLNLMSSIVTGTGDAHAQKGAEKRLVTGPALPDLDRRPHRGSDRGSLVGNRPRGCGLDHSGLEDEGGGEHRVPLSRAAVIANKVEAAYRRGDLFEKRRAMMEAWADWCVRVTPAIS
jgi:hypothetical protein